MERSLVAVLLLAAASPASADPTGIEAARDAWEEAFARGEGEAAAEALFTEDAKLLPPDSPLLEGREEIASYWQGAFDAGVTDLRLATVAVEENGDTAIPTGTWTVSVPTDEGGLADTSGKDLIVYKRSPDGAWLMD